MSTPPIMMRSISESEKNSEIYSKYSEIKDIFKDNIKFEQKI